MIWGGGYRHATDEIDNRFAVSWDPDERDDDTFSFFVQDEIRFWDEKARLTVGTKIEKADPIRHRRACRSNDDRCAFLGFSMLVQEGSTIPVWQHNIQ